MYLLVRRQGEWLGACATPGRSFPQTSYMSNSAFRVPVLQPQQLAYLLTNKIQPMATAARISSASRSTFLRSIGRCGQTSSGTRDPGKLLSIYNNPLTSCSASPRSLQRSSLQVYSPRISYNSRQYSSAPAMPTRIAFYSSKQVIGLGWLVRASG